MFIEDLVYIFFFLSCYEYKIVIHNSPIYFPSSLCCVTYQHSSNPFFPLPSISKYLSFLVVVFTFCCPFYNLCIWLYRQSPPPHIFIFHLLLITLLTSHYKKNVSYIQIFIYESWSIHKFGLIYGIYMRMWIRT